MSIPRTFIDTNVIVDWIILDATIKDFREKYPEEDIFNEKLKSMWEKYDKPKTSYDFMKKVKEKSRGYFYTTNFALSEVIPVVKGIYQDRLLAYDNIPSCYWTKQKRDSVDLTKMHKEQLWKEINLFANEFLGNPDEGSKKPIMATFSAYNLDKFYDLILEHDCRTLDSILVSQAINLKCKYFVTKDSPLKRLKQYNNLQIIDPKTFSLKYFR